jgi:hypothetical protein
LFTGIKPLAIGKIYLYISTRILKSKCVVFVFFLTGLRPGVFQSHIYAYIRTIHQAPRVIQKVAHRLRAAGARPESIYNMQFNDP